MRDTSLHEIPVHGLSATWNDRINVVEVEFQGFRFQSSRNLVSGYTDYLGGRSREQVTLSQFEMLTSGFNYSSLEHIGCFETLTQYPSP